MTFYFIFCQNPVTCYLFRKAFPSYFTGHLLMNTSSTPLIMGNSQDPCKCTSMLKGMFKVF